MRKRKRPDYTLRVVRYRAYPHTIPQSVWNIAKAQRALWNQLVALANQHSEWAGLLGDKKLGWRDFDATTHGLVRASPLDWCNGPDLLDRLRTAMRSKRWPRFHGALERISLSHRFTNGGIELDKVVDNRRAQRFSLQASADWQLPRKAHSPHQTHWRGRFQAGGETIEFAFALHRPLPANAILKRVAWLGKRSGAKWFWHFALTVEEPPSEQLTHQSTLIAGLDLGWRIFADGSANDYVRVGMLADSEGRMLELRLPLALRPGPGGERRRIHYLDELQSLVDAFINAAGELAGDKRLGRGKLREIAAHHENADGITAALAAADLLALRKREQRFHMIERRRWYYRNLAQWLMQRYFCLALEADLSLPELHKRTDDPALRASALYRNYAAVGELRQCLIAAAAKYGSKIEGQTAETTTTCWLCAAEATSGASLELTCANGHTWDQDRNAAKNLLSQMDSTFGQTHQWRKFTAATVWKRLDIPETIRPVAVEVPPG
jgi:hypothetical protein